MDKDNVLVELTGEGGTRQEGAGQEGCKISREGHEQRNSSGRTRLRCFVELMGQDFDPHYDESMSFVDPSTCRCFSGHAAND